MRPVLVYLVTDMALAILLGSSLGYLGLGAQPPTAEWGVLIADGKNFFTQAPWISLFPGIAIVLARAGLQPDRRRARRPVRTCGDDATLLRVEDLGVTFRTTRGPVHAVDGVDLAIAPGEVLGLVGEIRLGQDASRCAPSPGCCTRTRRVTGRVLCWRGEDLMGAGAAGEQDLLRDRAAARDRHGSSRSR